MKLSKFKTGDVVVVTENEDCEEYEKDERFPKGLITEVIIGAYMVCEKKLTIKALKSKSTWTYSTNKHLKYRPATEREVFLYHILGHPYCMNDIDQEEE